MREMSCGLRPVMSVPSIDNAARGRRQELGQQIEAGRLARAVRTDQRVNRSALHCDELTFLTAMKPPKDFERPSARKIGSALAALHSIRLPPRRMDCGFSFLSIRLV